MAFSGIVNVQYIIEKRLVCVCVCLYHLVCACARVVHVRACVCSLTQRGVRWIDKTGSWNRRVDCLSDLHITFSTFPSSSSSTPLIPHPPQLHLWFFPLLYLVPPFWLLPSFQVTLFRLPFPFFHRPSLLFLFPSLFSLSLVSFIPPHCLLLSSFMHYFSSISFIPSSQLG